SWLATNWGSDIYYYRNFPDHRSQIARLLRSIDFYSCECGRDIKLARELGLTAKIMPVMPNTGGFDIEQVGALRRLHSPSARRLIMIKGYQHFAGRAMTAIDALERCADVLKPYELMVFSASEEVAARARKLSNDGVLNFWITDYLPHDQMLRLQGRARVYIGISISDAISTSLLEAMAMGSFPIQTNTSCCDEWIADGRSGFIVPHDNVDLIADRIRRAVTDDALVNQAADINWETVQERLDERLLRKQAFAFYDEIYSDLERRKSLN
ncbi:MAG: glycosyltransferase, partial [Chromatiales bacterium]